MIGLPSEMIIHPGETLKEVLENKNMSQKELVLRGEKNMSASFAKKLEYALNIEAEFWVNLQNSYDKEILEYQK